MYVLFCSYFFVVLFYFIFCFCFCFVCVSLFNIVFPITDDVRAIMSAYRCDASIFVFYSFFTHIYILNQAPSINGNVNQLLSKTTLIVEPGTHVVLLLNNSVFFF